MRLRTKKETITVTIEDVTVTAEPLTPRETEDLRRRFTHMVGRGADRRQDFDSIGFTEAMFVKVVKSWTGAVDEEGKDLPCTAESKKLVFEHDQDFAGDVLAGIKDAVAERREVLEKN